VESTQKSKSELPKVGFVCKVEESLKMGTIYIATNLINQKQYVGRSVNFKGRKYTHLRLGMLGDKTYFHKALKKYGKNEFKWICVEYPIQELNEMEQFWIKTLNTKAPNGYNLTDGGEGTFNPCEETRLKMSEKKKGKYTGKDNHFFGKHHTEETRELLSKINMGENHPHWGIKHSEETKKRQSEGIKNCPQRKEINEKIKKARLKTYKFLSPNNDEIIWGDGIKNFCINYNLNYHSVCAVIGNYWKRTEYKGWKFIGVMK